MLWCEFALKILAVFDALKKESFPDRLEVILHSSPVAMLLLLASITCTALFVYRARAAHPSSNPSQAALTDGILFASVVTFVGFLLLHNLAQAIYGIVLKGIDADRPLTVAVENVFFYGCTGVVLIATMTTFQLLKKK